MHLELFWDDSSLEIGPRASSTAVGLSLGSFEM